MDAAVKKYFSKKSPADIAEYKRIKSIVASVLPDVTETISYAIPTLKIDGDAVMGFGANKDSWSFYPFSGQVVEDNLDSLKKFSVSKGTVKYTEDNPVSATIVKRLVRSRLKQIKNA